MHIVILDDDHIEFSVLCAGPLAVHERGETKTLEQALEQIRVIKNRKGI